MNYFKLTLIALVTFLTIGSAILMNPQQAKASSYDPVILVHGFNPNAAQNCNEFSEFGAIKSFFNSSVYPTVSVGYYNGDSNCDYYLGAEYQHCTGWYNGNGGTVNEDIRHISCLLAWYIWDNYTQWGVHVQVVAHSMGGIIIRQAMFDTPFETRFPPYLRIDNVVTAGTPHQGLDAGAALGMISIRKCNWPCTQIAQLEAYNPLMSNLNSTSFRSGFGRDPAAPGWGSTDWSTMISGVDGTIGQWPNSSPETLNFPNNPYLFNYFPKLYVSELDGLMPGATHFVVYPYYYDNGTSLTEHQPYYRHGGYLVDTNTHWDAYAMFSNNNGYYWTTSFTWTDSIQTMLYAILYTSW